MVTDLFSHRTKAGGELEALYHSKLEEMSVNYESLKIETSFGNTNIILAGQEGKPPLVLLPGACTGAPMAIEALLGLKDDFRIYAIDIGEVQKLNAEISLSPRNNSYGQWMFEILSRLNIRQVILVGISFGGFISWKTLVFEERRIAKTFLITPSGIINGHSWKLFRKVVLPWKLYQWRKQSKYIHRMLESLVTQPDEDVFSFLSNVFLHFEADFLSMPLIKKEEAQRIKTPVCLIAADDDVLFPGLKMLKRAQEIFPSLVEVLLLRNSKHVPGQPGYQQIIELIKKG